MYEESDLEDLLSAWLAASEIAHPFLTKKFLASEKDNIKNLYLPNTETWVYEEDRHVIGFVSLMGTEVGAIFVHPDHQGKGIGRELMDKARDQRGTLEVEVFEANSIGRKFYDRYGFEPLGASIHEPTGNAVVRLRLPASKPTLND